MKIAICGCGWSGAILSNMLTEYGRVDVYELNKQPTTVCACGVPLSFLRHLTKKLGFNPEEYVLWKSNRIILDFGTIDITIPVRNLCTFDKEKLMKDLVQASDANFSFGKKASTELKNRYDLVVDATGKRALLGPLPNDKILQAFQVKARFKELPYPDFYMNFSDPSSGGYLWMFPISDKLAYVGCGGYSGSYIFHRVQRFIKRFKGRVLERRAKSSRVNSPIESMPFFKGNIVGVGTSIGTISRLGEGNALSAKSAEFLAEHLNNLKEYSRKVLAEFRWLSNDYSFFEAYEKKLKSKLIYFGTKIWKIYKRRFDIRVTLSEFLSFIYGTLRWAFYSFRYGAELGVKSRKFK